MTTVLKAQRIEAAERERLAAERERTLRIDAVEREKLQLQQTADLAREAAASETSLAQESLEREKLALQQEQMQLQAQQQEAARLGLESIERERFIIQMVDRERDRLPRNVNRPLNVYSVREIGPLPKLKNELSLRVVKRVVILKLNWSYSWNVREPVSVFRCRFHRRLLFLASKRLSPFPVNYS